MDLPLYCKYLKIRVIRGFNVFKTLVKISVDKRLKTVFTWRFWRPLAVNTSNGGG